MAALEKDLKLEHRLTRWLGELRTPLMAILATVEAMQDGVLPADQERLENVASGSVVFLAWLMRCCICRGLKWLDFNPSRENDLLFWYRVSSNLKTTFPRTQNLPAVY